jgi:hypothetical protein
MQTEKLLTPSGLGYRHHLALQVISIMLLKELSGMFQVRPFLGDFRKIQWQIHLR